MLGFAPLTTIPIADILLGNTVTVAGQNLTLTQSSVSAAISANINLTGQTALVIAQNSTSITATANYTLTGQDLTFTQSTLGITASSVELLIGQASMNVSLNSTETTAAADAVLQGQTALELTQTSTSITATANYELIGQPLTLTQNNTKEAVAPTLSSHTLNLTLHSMRMWNKINSSQMPDWTSINTTQNPDWVDIPT
jgi:hypothetical protein